MWVVAAITVLPCFRACFWRLNAKIFAVSRSKVLVNSSSIQNGFCDAVKRAIW